VETEDCSNFGGTSGRRFESINLASMSFDENTGSVSDAVGNILALTAVTTVWFRYDHLEDGTSLTLDSLVGSAIHDPTASGAFPVQSSLSNGTLEVTGARSDNRFKIKWDLTYGDDFQTTVGEKWMDFPTAPFSILPDPLLLPNDYVDFVPPDRDCNIEGDVVLDSDDALRNALPLCTISGMLTLTDTLSDVSLLAQLEAVGGLSITRSQLPTLQGLENLRTIEGTLVIDGNTQLAQMDALSNIDGLTHFVVSGNTQLPRVVFPSQQTEMQQIIVEANTGTGGLEGLELLTTVDALRVRDNPVLGGVAAPLLTSVNDLEVYDNDNLALLDFAALETAGDVHIGQNNLLDLQGLSSLTEADSLNVETERLVTDLDGLDALTYVDGALSLRGLIALEVLDGLPALTHASTLDLSYNAELTAITGFPSLTSLNSLTVTENDVLTTLGGFNTLDDLQHLSIRGNLALPSIDLLDGLQIERLEVERSSALTSIFPTQATTTVDTLVSRFNYNLVTLGGPGAEVTTTLDVSDSEALSSIGIGFAGPLETVRLDDVGLTDFTGIGPTTIDSLTVDEVPLTSLTGLETATIGVLSLSDVPALSDLSGVPLTPSLTEIRLLRTGVTHLDALAGHPSLGRVHLENNAQLTSLTGLADLQSIDTLVVLDAPLLTDVPDWGALTTVDQLWLQSTNLAAFPTLEALTTATFGVHILDNPALTSLDGLNALTSSSRLIVRDNPQLTSLAGLTSLDTVSASLEIVGNDALCQSFAERVSSQLPAGGGTVNVYNNLDGC
jgi:hypothetical protein